MASVHREGVIDRPRDEVWDALRDVGALHTRLVPGFVTDCRLEPGARIVTFANGRVARELIVGALAHRGARSLQAPAQEGPGRTLPATGLPLLSGARNEACRRGRHQE